MSTRSNALEQLTLKFVKLSVFRETTHFPLTKLHIKQFFKILFTVCSLWNPIFHSGIVQGGF